MMASALFSVCDEREFREDVDDYSEVLYDYSEVSDDDSEELLKKWTTWIAIIKPKASKGWRWKRKNWYTNLAGLKKLIDDESGIYELRLNKEGKTCVVYIGSSCAEGGLYDRLSQYATDGSHKVLLIQKALSEGATIEARACTLKDCGTARARENEILEQLDYSWNIRSNLTPRKQEAFAKALHGITVYQ